MTDRKGRPISVIVSIVLTILTLGYFLPWMIAAMRGKSNHIAIMVVNLLLGWTIIGWIVALVMACTAHQVAGVRMQPQPYYPPQAPWQPPLDAGSHPGPAHTVASSPDANALAAAEPTGDPAYPRTPESPSGA